MSEVVFLLNAEETVVMTSQINRLRTIRTDHGIIVRVLPGNVAQKCLGCMLTAKGSEPQKKIGLAILPSTSGKGVSCQQMEFGGPEGFISHCLHYFDPVVSSVACFAGGHRTICQNTYKPWTFIFENSAAPF